MIYTLTPNPAIDLNVTADKVVPNEISRTRDAVYSPNGKGLNVSFTLQHYGIQAPILGFFGGFSGEYIVRGARKRGCVVHSIAADGITRINTFVTCGTDEYAFPNAGCPVSCHHQREMLSLIDSLPELDCLVVSGSLPPYVKPEFYDSLIEHVHGRGGEIVLDTSHRHLSKLVKLGPLLIKPNDDEIEKIFDARVDDTSDVLKVLRLIHMRGCQNVLLTLGDRGSYFSDGDCVWYANAARVDAYSSVCAGDATLAAFLSIWFFDRAAVSKALIRAMATGANVAMCAGLGDFSQVEELTRQIHARRIA